RHTRFSRDWSSDVCSSDLTVHATRSAAGYEIAGRDEGGGPGRGGGAARMACCASGQAQRVGEQVGEGGLGRPDHEAVLPQRRDRSEERRVGKEGRARWSAE